MNNSLIKKIKKILPSRLEKVVALFWHKSRIILFGVKNKFYQFLDKYRLNDLSSVYDDKYFTKRNTGKRLEETEIIGKIFYKEFKPKSVIDFGWATGTLLKVFKKRGTEILGLEI